MPQEKKGVNSSFYFGLRMEDLSEQLCRNLAQEKKEYEDPFRKTLIFVPNRNVRRYLQLRLAEAGLSFNSEYHYLESGIRYLLEAVSGRVSPELIDVQTMHLLIAKYFTENPGSEPVLEFFPESVKIPDYFQTDRFSRKLWFLSGKIASVFADYEFHRTPMIEEWLGLKSCPDFFYEELASAEKNHRNHPDYSRYEKLKKIQKALFAEITDRAKKERGAAHLWEYASAVFSAITPESVSAKNTSVHLIGFSQLSRMHISIIFNLSNYLNINFYIPDTGHSFLFDFSHAQQKKSSGEWIPVKGLRSGASAIQDPLQKYWGSPAADLIRLMHRMKQEHHSWYIHQSLIRDTDEPWSLREKSYMVINCPGIYREAESIFQSIQNELKADSSLRLTDIAILVHDMEKYRPVLESVFCRDPEKSLPFNLTDFSAGNASRFAAAIRSFFEIMQKGLSSKLLLELAENPLVKNKWEKQGLDTAVWRKWIRQLNIAGSDALDSDSQIPDKFSWQHGLRRLRLSYIFHSALADPEKSDLIKKTGIPSDASALGSTENLSAFTDFTEMIMELRRQWKSAVTFGQRSVIIKDFLYIFIKIDQDKSEITASDRFHRSFANLSILWGKEKPVSPVLFRLMTESLLEEISGSIGKFFTEGVTISAMQPMRPVPFRIIYIPGMREGDFPGRDRKAFFDLRRFVKLEGDTDRPLISRNLLLESIQAARSKVIFTYSGRDVQKDVMHYRCGPLLELQNFLFTGMQTEKLTDCGIYPEIQEGEGGLRWEEKCAGLRLMPREVQAETTGTRDPLTVLKENENIVNLLSIADYYKNSLKLWLRRKAGIHDAEDPEEETRESEPFRHNYMESSVLRKKALMEYIASENEESRFGAIIAKNYRNQEYSSLAPAPPFSVYALREETAKEESRAEAAKKILKEQSDSFYSGISFGGNKETYFPYSLQFPPVTDTATGKIFEFSLPFLFKKNRRIWGAAVILPESSSLNSKDKTLENILFPYIVFSFIKKADFSVLAGTEHYSILEDIQNSVRKSGFIILYLNKVADSKKPDSVFTSYDFTSDEISDFSDFLKNYENMQPHLVSAKVLLDTEISPIVKNYINSVKQSAHKEPGAAELKELEESLKLWFLDRADSKELFSRTADYYRDQYMENRELPQDLHGFLKPLIPLLDKLLLKTNKEDKDAGKKEQ